MNLPSKHSETGILHEVWRHFNKLRDYTQSLTPSPGVGIRFNWTSNGVSHSLARSSEVGSDIRTFQIVSIHDNYLTCVEWDGGTPGTTEIDVARPWLQRRYVYEGDTELTITYVSEQEVTATDGTTSETWKITRAYRVGDMIMAVKLYTESDVGTWDWIDQNMDGRDWAKV